MAVPSKTYIRSSSGGNTTISERRFAKYNHCRRWNLWVRHILGILVRYGQPIVISYTSGNMK